MPRSSWLHSLVCAWTTCAVLFGGCRTTPAPVTTRPVATRVQPAATPLAFAPSGRPEVPFDEAVEDGKIATTLGASAAVATAGEVSELPAAETSALLARLEPLPALDNAGAPSIRPASAPPPRAGGIQPIAFVAQTGTAIADKPVSPAADRLPATVALSAPRIEPSGEIMSESEIRVRFDEPMVPVAAVGETKTAPAQITPAVPGVWRWLDTRVAQFTAAGSRLPKATEYTVTVPAGTKALSGAVLMRDETGTFQTPGPRLAGRSPYGLRFDSPVAVEIDQKVDAAAITKLLRVEDEVTHRPVAFTVIGVDEARTRWARNPAIDNTDSVDGPNVLVLAPKTSWPPGRNLLVKLAKGAPSLEGPRRSQQVSALSFSIAPAFRVVGILCGDSATRMTGAVCESNSYLNLQLTNTVDQKSFRSSMVQIAGQPFDDHAPSGSMFSLETPLKVGGPFSITIADGLVDEYAQPLVGSRELSFSTKRGIYMPSLSARGGVYVLDPRYEIPQWVIETQAVAKLHVDLYKVETSDFFAYADFLDGKRKQPPGKKVAGSDHSVGARKGAKLRVDLRPALGGSSTGHVIAVATATQAAGAGKLDEWTRQASAWIQVTKLGLSLRQDSQRVNVWTHDISPSSFLRPVGGVQTSLLIEGRSDAPPAAATDATGHATCELLPPDDKPEPPRTLVLAKPGEDSTFQRIHTSERTVTPQFARRYVTDDRFTYKPGEPLYVKGWVRTSDTGINPDIHVPGAGTRVTYVFKDVRGNTITSGAVPLTSQGGFDLTVDLPPTINLGLGMLTLSTAQGSYSHPVSIEEFRTPAYAVNLTDDVLFSGSRPLLAGESISMSTEAKYFAGGGLPGAKIDWAVELASARYEPPGWDRYTFAPPRSRAQRNYYRGQPRRIVNANEGGTLSGTSTSNLDIAIHALPRHEPSLLSVDATVSDVDRQTIRASSRKILVHPASKYIGMRLDPEADDQLQLVVTDIDGTAVSGVPVLVEIEGVLGSERARDDAKVVDTQQCKVTSAAGPVRCHFTRKDDQTAYVAKATVHDERGRSNVVQMEIPWWTWEDEDLSVTPDKQSYKPGDVAKLTITSKQTPGVAIVTFARQGVIAQKRVELGTKHAIGEPPITATALQNAPVRLPANAQRRHQAEAKSVPAASKPLPEHTTAQIELRVDQSSARLTMRARPLSPIVEPGAKATFEVEVKHGDKPVKGAEVALLVVDEAVLSVSGRSHEDPLGRFYESVASGTSTTNTFALVEDAGGDLGGVPGFEAYSLDVPGRQGFGRGYGVGAGSMGGRAAAAPSVRMGAAVVKARKDFRATAVFSPVLATDANGKVRVTVTMPDSLTRFRIVALATSDTHYFGKAESNLVAQRKMNVRTVAPRFLTQGDSFSLPVVVQNLDDAPRTIDVAVRVGNLASRGPQGKRVTVPGGQRAEVRFDLATMGRGRAVIQTIAVAGSFADASSVNVQVYEPATTESFATYGSVTDKTAFERLAVPADVFRDVGGVEAEVSSTQLQNLTDAYWYLYAYPYECAEQRSSRMLATTAVADILDAFAVPGRPSKQEIIEQRALDVRKLARDQQRDGGWGYFPGMPSDPFVTAQVLAALASGGDRSDTTKQAIGYVTNHAASLLATLEKTVKVRGRMVVTNGGDGVLVSLAAASLSALGAAGNDVTTRAQRLHAAATALAAYPVDAKARVLAALAGQPRYEETRHKLLGDLLSATHETAAAATVTVPFTDAERMLLGSETKTNALTLDALLREAPQEPIITKLARGILDSRQRGRWRSTQDNLVVLQALRRYFDIYEKDTPDFTGKLWLGDKAYAEQAFKGRTTARGVTHASWDTLEPGSTHDIAIDRTGTGRMYYRLGITYAPKRTDLPALDAGFVVRRTYKAVDDPSDVVQQRDGTWRIKLGARVLVQLEALNTSSRHAVALVDPLPAGLEPVNTRLVTSERAAAAPDDAAWEYVAMRDNRGEAFMMDLGAGSHRFSYTARATTPGAFIAAPAKAEEMYSPETFGRSAGTTVVVQ